MIDNNTCPICSTIISLKNTSSLKYDQKHICTKCSMKLAKQGINIFNYKKYKLEELKEKAYHEDIKNGKILECPNCKSHNLEIISNDKNYKTKYRTTLNLNPLRIFTLTNTKEIKKETSKNHNEYYCKDCGYKWIGK